MDLSPKGESIKERVVRIAPNIIMRSSFIQAEGKNVTSFEFPGISFERESKKDSKVFRFNLPFGCAYKMRKGLDFLIQENSAFFLNGNDA